MGIRNACAIALGSFLIACGGDAATPDASVTPVGPIEPAEQRSGDADDGWRALITESYVGCGVPRSAYDTVVGPAPASLRLPERAGTPSEVLPYNLTALTLPSGAEVVAPNCLQCHAERFNGQLVVGLGSHTQDYTDDLTTYATLACGLVDDPVEQAECERWQERTLAVAPYTVTETIGVNPADNLAAVLFAHRDPETLAWLPEPALELPPAVVVPVDVPPWWRMQKKHAMFYVAAGRGDHARIMMTASTLCVDSVDEARAIDAYFPDVRSFLLSLEPPAWPYEVDAELAAAGKAIFDDACAACHGTYGEPADETYPNLVIALDDVGTDSTLALGAAQFAGRFVDWFNRSFYGELSWLAPAEGYVAPPLDGIWATAPFLHNGSVPTLAALLDSSTRPRYFTRSYGTSTADYDPDAVGWRVTPLDAGQDEAPDRATRVRIYDTTLLGYGNGGHTYGDGLTEPERTAVLEYLKTI
jgi:mono/diheme cytochrome c family protein